MPFGHSLRRQFRLIALLMLGFCPVVACSQEGTADPASSDVSSVRESIRAMQLQIQQLQTMILAMKSQADDYRAETLQLKHELQLTREKLESLGLSAQMAGPPDNRPTGGSSGEKNLVERVTRLEEDQQLTNAKVDDQYQTKIEAASKYRVKLSGILLMNVFSNKGNTDHFEVPNVALASTTANTSGNTGGSFGATFRQSEIGLEIYGPSFAGARTRGHFVGDFFGEFPETVNGASSGSFRLRTGTVRMDWSGTSVVAGLDDLFFSPGYPTSFASLGIPAFSYSGNLWGWTPQVRIEHRLLASDTSTLTLSGGILDPLTGETPPNEFLRVPGAGESSRQPAYGAGLAWLRKVRGRPLTIGVGGYYNRENWGFNRNVDGWAATMDWNVPLGAHISLSGKFYSGRAIGGLGAGVGRSIVFNGSLADPAATIRALQSTGGWSQLKITPAAKLEFNIAAGQDGAAAGDVRGFAEAPGYFAANLTRNRSEFVNFIYKPRSNILFSTEFRTLRTFAVDGPSERANQLNLIMGVLF